jgi:hypothetical protein
MKRFVLATIAAATMALGLAAVPADAASGRVQVGRLACDVEPGVGLIVVSHKDLTCWFHRDGARPERYTGSISKIGIDIGVTAITHVEWLVFAATKGRYSRHALAGDYVGGSAEATIGVGLGANWLVGGSGRSFALQPLSLQGQVGLNYSVAFSALSLR